MRYISTRGNAPTLSFKDALLVGLASDGGLYVPAAWPKLTLNDIRSFRGKPYTEVAFAVMSPFVGGEIDDVDLRQIIEEAYATFHHPAVTPLVQMGPNDWLLELFHGPTLAFKDVAMQMLSRLMDHVLRERGERLTIVGATSGDTGGAALEAFKNCNGIDTFFMFPNGKVSDFQRRQMTTIGAENCHAIAIDGSFDDCQSMVKDMFGHQSFANKIRLSAVNSTNWGRVMAQVCITLLRRPRLAPLSSASALPCRLEILVTYMPASLRSRWACRSVGWSSPRTKTTFLRAL